MLAVVVVVVGVLKAQFLPISTLLLLAVVVVVVGV